MKKMKLIDPYEIPPPSMIIHAIKNELDFHQLNSLKEFHYFNKRKITLKSLKKALKKFPIQKFDSKPCPICNIKRKIILYAHQEENQYEIYYHDDEDEGFTTFETHYNVDLICSECGYDQGTISSGRYEEAIEKSISYWNEEEYEHND